MNRSMIKTRTKKLTASEIAGLVQENEEFIQESVRLAAYEILGDLQANSCGIDWTHVANEFRDSMDLIFDSEYEKEDFENGLLETRAAIYAGKESFSRICWKFFKRNHPDWNEDDFEGANEAVLSLPTVAYAAGGTILFIARSQLEALRNNPWICGKKSNIPKKQLYVNILNIDELVIVPNK